MIDRATVAKILDAADIYDVVSDFVTLKKRGANYWGCCPFHNEKTPSFSVNPSKGIFKCFGCGEGGGAAKFIMKHENVSYPDALRYLAKKYNIEINEREETEEEKAQNDERESLLTVTEFAAKHFETMLHESDEGKAVGLSFFHERGVSDETIKKFRLGYAPEEWSLLMNAAQKGGYQLDFLEKCGLIRRKEGKNEFYDFFRDRVVFPWFSRSGQVIGFTARVMSRETKGVNQKYINSPESLIFKKDEEIFGIYQASKAISKAECVYMVEGQFDVISMHQCGIENVVACSGGKGLSMEQAMKLKRLQAKEIVLMYDSDAAGEKDTNQAIGVALEANLGVKIVRLPEGSDPDDFCRKHNADEVMAYIDENRIDFATYKCRQILSKSNGDPTRKIALVKDELLPLLAAIQDKMMRYEFLKICSDLLDIEIDTLNEDVTKFIKRQTEERARQAERERQERQRDPMPEPPPPDYGDVPYSPDDVPQDAPVAPKSDPKKIGKLEQLERNILQFALRYGNEQIFVEDNEVWTVNRYIVHELLEVDQITLRDPLCRTVLFEIAAHHTEPEFSPRFFDVNYGVGEVSSFVTDLLSSRYTVSRIFTDDENAPKVEGTTEREIASSQERRNRYEQKQHDAYIQGLCEELQHVILEYKTALVLDEINRATIDLKKACDNHDDAAMAQILQRLDQLNKTKKQAAELLSGRVIVKL
jgi:DNA primase